MTETKIARLREEIDAVDDNILLLIKKRLQLTKEIGLVKKENGMTIIDTPREKALFDALEKKCQDLKIDADKIANIWQQILEASYKSQE